MPPLRRPIPLRAWARLPRQHVDARRPGRDTGRRARRAGWRAVTLASAVLWLIGATATAAVATGKAPAVTAGPSPTSPPSPSAQPLPALTDANHISWIGTLTLDRTNPETGERLLDTWDDTVVTLLCEGSACMFVARAVGEDTQFAHGATGVLFTAGGPLSVPDDAASAAGPYPARGDMCVDLGGYSAAGVRTIEASATALTVTNATEEFTVVCEGGATAHTRWASLRTFTGVFLDGDACVLDGAECGVDAAVAAAVTPAPAPPPVAVTPGPAATTHASAIASGDVAAASVLTALPPVQDLSLTVLDVCTAILATVILALLVAFPKKLYASALGALPGRWAGHKEWASRRTGPLGRWWHGVLTRPARPPRTAAPTDHADAPADAPPQTDASPHADAPPLADSSPPEERHAPFSGPWRRAALGVVLAGVVSAFVDPGFGLNPGSVRVAFSLATSFVLNVVIGWSVAIWIARRFTPGLAATYRFKPLSLLVVALTVVFTRATGMQPGMVFGLVAGVALGTMASKATQARVAVAQTGYAFALGLAGWLAYSVLAPTLAATTHLPGRLLIDTLAGLSIAGFSAAPLALLPVAGMGGATVFEWSRRWWFALYATGLLGFFVVLMPMSYSWKDVEVPLAAWITLYAAYAGVALVLYAALVQPWRRAQRADAEEEGVEGDAGDDTGDHAAEVVAPERLAAGSPAEGVDNAERAASSRER